MEKKGWKDEKERMEKKGWKESQVREERHKQLERRTILDCYEATDPGCNTFLVPI